MEYELDEREDSAFVGVLGGGFGEPPVRIADLEAAAARRSAARRRMAGHRHTTLNVGEQPADELLSDVEDYAQLGEN
jgi:hypothetical protein